MKTQRGIITGIEILVILLVLAAVAGAATAIVHTYNHALERAQTAENESKVKTLALTDQLVINAGLRAAQDLLNQQLAARQATDQRIAALERKFNDNFGKLIAQSPEARKWAATAVPDDVRRVVRERAGAGPGSDQDKAGAAAAAVVKPDAGAGVPRPNVYHRRPADVRPALGGSGK